MTQPADKPDPVREDLGFESWAADDLWPAALTLARPRSDNELYFSEEQVRAAYVAGRKSIILPESGERQKMAGTCMYCGHVFRAKDTSEPEVARVYAESITHDRECPDNPLVKRIAELERLLDDALHTGAALAAKLEAARLTASLSASGSNWQHFDAAYAKACESSEPKDWMQAALFAQQVRNAVSTSGLPWVHVTWSLPDIHGPDVLVAGNSDGVKVWQASPFGPHDPAWLKRYEVTHWTTLPAIPSATGTHSK